MTLHDIPDPSDERRTVPEYRATPEEEAATVVLRQELGKFDAPVKEKTDKGFPEYYQVLPLSGIEPGDIRSLIVDYGEKPKSDENLPQKVRVVTRTDDGAIDQLSLQLNPGYHREGWMKRPVAANTVTLPTEWLPFRDEWHFAGAEDFELFARALDELEQSQLESTNS